MEHLPTNNSENEYKLLPERYLDLDRPMVWIGSLSDYNNANLHGWWMDAGQDTDDLRQEIQAMLNASPQDEQAEEWMIFDTDNFAGIRICEYEDLDTITRHGQNLLEHGPAYGAWIETGADPITENFGDAFLGEYDSATAYAEQIGQDLGWEDLLDQHLPDHLRHYVSIDYTMLARDLELGSDITTVEKAGGGVWVFDAR